MEDLLTDPESLKYGAAVGSTALAYGVHRVKKEQVRSMTSSEIEMYLDGENNDFEPDISDIPYLKAAKKSREENNRYNEETGMLSKIRP